jgi:ATP-dependent RNA/DNA helicase IGHMBP2
MLLRAIQYERKQEEDFFSNFNATKSIPERIQAGLLWYPVQINRRSFSIGDYLEIDIERTKNLGQSHKINVGASAQLFHQDKDIQSCKVIVSRVRGNRITLMVHQDMAEVIDDYDRGLIGLEAIYDDKPYAMMEKALKAVAVAKEQHYIDIIHMIHGNAGHQVRSLERLTSSDLQHRTDLNESQKSTITSCLNCPHIGVIHGPPGTGKTTTIVGLVGTG